VFGEDAQLFKNDTVTRWSTPATRRRHCGYRYYGEDFTRSYMSYVTTLLSEPPPFIIAAMLDQGLCLALRLRTYRPAEESYTLVLQGPSNLNRERGGEIALYQRKAE